MTVNDLIQQSDFLSFDDCGVTRWSDIGSALDNLVWDAAPGEREEDLLRKRAPQTLFGWRIKKPPRTAKRELAVKFLMNQLHRWWPCNIYGRDASRILKIEESLRDAVDGWCALPSSSLEVVGQVELSGDELVALWMETKDEER